MQGSAGGVESGGGRQREKMGGEKGEKRYNL